jgi:hypothetical protein
MAHTTLAIFELFSGRHGEARRRLHHALDLNPNSEVARGYLGASYGFGGGCEAAMPHLDEAIQLSPRGLLVGCAKTSSTWTTCFVLARRPRAASGWGRKTGSRRRSSA